MPWTPSNPATDVRAIVSNLLTFFTTNQSDALLWAHGSALTAFTFYPTAEVRMKTDFPHLGVVKRRVTTEDTDAGLEIEYRLTFELEVAKEHTKANRTAKLLELQAETDNRCYAIESMFLNIPEATLFANVRGTGHGWRSITSSDPLEVAISETKSLFNVQMEAILRFRETPYN
jgi:hypothetical protein